jgi:two-component system sensor histidine kinase VicK
VNSSILGKFILDKSYFILGAFLLLFLSLLSLIIRSLKKKIKIITSNLEHIIVGDINNWTENKSKITEIAELDKYSKFILEKFKNTVNNAQEKNKINTINLIQEKNQKEKLNTEVNRFKKAFDNAYNMMYIISPKGLIIYANDALLTTLDKNFSELEGKKPTEVWHTQKEEETWETEIKNILQNKKSDKFECKAIRFDRMSGTEKEYEAEVALSPILNNLSQVENILVIEKDVSDERQKDRIKTEFISVVSHELRTPMTIIRGYSSILADGKVGELNEKQAEYVKKINDETGRLLNLANDMLDLQKFEVGKVKLQLEAVNMLEMMQEMKGEYEGIYQKKGLYITFENYANKYTASIDKRYFHRAIANLLNNALKFTEKGGVQLQLLNPDEKTLVIVVKDTGIGIPVDAVEHLFTKFYQASNVLNRKQEGSGLGLSIVKNIVEAHEGIVWVESKEMIGTTFYIALNL